MWTGEFHTGVYLAFICEFVYAFICITIWFNLGEVLVYPVRDRYLCCAKILRVSCLRIQRGCECEKVSRDNKGKGASEECVLLCFIDPRVRKIRNESRALRDSYCMEKHFCYVYTRWWRYKGFSWKEVKRFDLRVCDGELRCFCPSRQPAWVQPCARLVIHKQTNKLDIVT